MSGTVGFLIGLDHAQPTTSALQDSWENGYTDGKEDGLTSLPDGQPRVLFHQGQLFNRTIAFVYPEAEISYRCNVSRATQGDGGGEWVIAQDAYKYNGSVACDAVAKDLLPAYDSTEINDTLLRNAISNSSTE